MNLERKVSAFDPVKFDAVIPQYLPATVRRHLLMKKLLGGFGEVRVAVRIVAGENQIVVADQLADVADICFVAFAADYAGRWKYSLGFILSSGASRFPSCYHFRYMRCSYESELLYGACASRNGSERSCGEAAWRRKELGISWQKSSSRFLYAGQITSASSGSCPALL